MFSNKAKIITLIGLEFGIVMGFMLVFFYGKSTWVPTIDVNLSIDLLKQNGRGLLKVSDFTKLQAGIEELSLTPIDSPSLVIYRFNTPRLCGVGGCLYSIYDRAQNRRLFQILLGDNPSITIVDKCLKIEQLNKNVVKNIKYCNNNGTYIQSTIEDKLNEKS